jgi:hypothetical protein
MDPRIQIRIQTKMSWIRNSAAKESLYSSREGKLVKHHLPLPEDWLNGEIRPL